MVVRLGIVGCGRISAAHGNAADRLGDGVRFSACADVNEESARRFANTYGSNSIYTDYREMIAKEDLDGVVFATWPGQHREQLTAALDAGVKFILCEKALSLEGEEALAIYEAAEARGATIVEAFMYMHHPAIAKLDELVFRSESGPVDSVRGSFHLFLPNPEAGKETWRQNKATGGSVPYDRTCYPVSGCARYAGALPVSASATVTVEPAYDTIVRLYGTITYDNGVVAYVESSNTAIFSQELQVTCANRVYRLNTPFTMAGDGVVEEYEALKFSHVKETQHPVASSLPLQHDLPTYEAYTPQLKRFVETIRGGAQPHPRLIDTVVNSYALDALVKSGLEKRVVDIRLPERVRAAWAEGRGA